MVILDFSADVATVWFWRSVGAPQATKPRLLLEAEATEVGAQFLSLEQFKEVQGSKRT